MPYLEWDIRLEADARNGCFHLFSKKQELYNALSCNRWLGDEEISPILQEISHLKPAMARLNGITGCDGETFNLTIVSGEAEARFQWWCEPPEGWEGLVMIASMLEDIANVAEH